MGHSQADKAKSRERILDAAARQIGERGLDSVAVSELMQSAGLTKGAFYGHFESRETMIAEAAKRAMDKGQSKLAPLFEGDHPPTLEQVVDAWLNPAHIQDPTSGCGICTLAGEARYAGPEVQRVVADQFRINAAQIASTMGKDAVAMNKAIAILTIIVGAVSTARAVGDPDLANDILTNAKGLAMQAGAR